MHTNRIVTIPADHKKYFVEIHEIMLTYLYFPDIFLIDNYFLTLEYLLFELRMDVLMMTEKKKSVTHNRTIRGANK